jgi:hypothetical protein
VNLVAGFRYSPHERVASAADFQQTAALTRHVWRDEGESLIRFDVVRLRILVSAFVDHEDNPTSPSGPTAVDGSVNKAPVAGAALNIHRIDADGSIGTLVAGPFTTDTAGNWSGEIPASTSGNFVMVATGGSYVDEATGNTVALAAGQELFGILKGSSAHVTPLSHAIFQATQALVDGGTPLATAIARATSSSVPAFGFDFATTAPSDLASASANQKEYAALLGGLSTLLDANPLLGAFTSTRPVDLVTAVASDMADGKLDALDAFGSSIQVPTDASGTPTAALPALSPADLSAWLNAANSYAATVSTLDGVSFNPSTAWNPSSLATGGGSGSVVFSGDGAASLPSVDFDVTSSGTFDVQIFWSDDVNNVEILVVPNTLNGIRTAYVSHTIGETSLIWNAFNDGGIPGITRSGGKVTFTDASLNQLTGGTTTLILKGVLTEPVSK